MSFKCVAVCLLPIDGDKSVGWVERSDTHRLPSDGYRRKRLNPSYGLKPSWSLLMPVSHLLVLMGDIQQAAFLEVGG